MIKTSDKIVRRFDLAEIIFKYKKNIICKVLYIFLILENDLSEIETSQILLLVFILKCIGT